MVCLLWSLREVHPRGDEAQLDMLIICMLTLRFKALLLSTLPDGLLGDRRLPTLSVLYHSPISITDPLSLRCSEWLRQEEGEELGGDSDTF